MGLKFSYDDSALGRDIVRLAIEKDKEISEVVKGSARRISGNLAFETEPRGFDESAHMSGMLAAKEDMHKVYGDKESAYAILFAQNPSKARVFYQCMSTGQYLRAQVILAQSGTTWRNVNVDPLNEDMHNNARNNRGRVVRRVPLQIVQSKEELDEFITKQMSKVGLGAAGWSRCATILGSSRLIPGWKKGSHGVPFELGNVIDNLHDPDTPFVIMENLLPYISNICDEEKMEKATEREEEVLADLVDRAIAAAVKRAGF